MKIYREATEYGAGAGRSLVSCPASARILAEELQTPIGDSPGKLGPAPAPVPVPHLNLERTRDTKGVRDLKAHLALLNEAGVNSPGGSLEVDLLVQQVGRWIEYIQAQIVKVSAKPLPRRQVIRPFDKRSTALNKLVDKMRSRDLCTAY